PDQLDQLMPLTNPRGWIALAAGALLLVAALLWSIFGTISVTVEGEGVFTRPGGVRTVSASEAGRVEDVAARVGKPVNKGDTLLHLSHAAGGSRPGSTEVVSPSARP